MPGTDDLRQYLEADGHVLKAVQGGYMMSCPFHADATPSCSVRRKGGVWFYKCFGCDAQGDTVRYLAEYRGLSMKDALRLVNGEQVSAAGAAKTTRAPAKPEPGKKKREWMDTLPERYAARYTYRSAEGRILFVVQRYVMNGRKVPVPYTRGRQTEGGPVRWVKGLMIARDRPLYGLVDLLADDADRQVMVVEGEKCRDAVARASRKALCVSWCGGVRAWSRTDFTPLHGRKLLLVADGDQAGHDCMKEIAGHLSAHCPDIVLVLPPMAAKGEKALDIADEIEARPKGVAKWLRDHAVPWTGMDDGEPPPPEEGRREDAQEPMPEVIDTSRMKLNGSKFAVEGWHGERVEISTAFGTMRVTKKEMQSPAFWLNLVPSQKYWKDLTGSEVNRAAALQLSRTVIAAATEGSG